MDPWELPIIGPGKNSIPTIHILDLIALLERIIYSLPKQQYIFAVDRTKDRSLRNIIGSISKGTGNGTVKHFPETQSYSDDEIPNALDLLINIKVKTSKIFDDEKLDDEEEEDFEKRKFKWHCEVIKTIH